MRISIAKLWTRPRAALCRLGWTTLLTAILAGAVPKFAWAQLSAAPRPVPILTGSAGYFTVKDNGETELVPEVIPVVLLPLGDRWLVEARGEFKGEFARREDTGNYGGQVENELDYLQVDYIANSHLTVTAGRFLTPFGMYNERIYPIWIRDLQLVPLIFSIGTGSSDGIMFRGGFALNSKVNLNYATYFSTLSTVNKFESDRTTGGRVGLFFTGPRIEVGGSFQKELQEDRKNSFGFHFAWQPTPLPLNLRAEYARSVYGSGYWVEGAYRLGQIPHWNKVMRKTEFVARMQQTFAGEEQPEGDDEYNLPRSNVQQPDFGLNYYIKDGLKVSGSYSRWLGRRNWNTWTIGIAYRFAIPLGRAE
ncbi:MAG: hypothetical protein JST79_18735 [Acidobacteria bacterium]|nr:hypothetical protein [Acidobacteriota bacterium]